ncbi:MAG: hypothetical protein LUE29_09740 [Lachnospiraceae bacterium]|nr:hypothetical protein [Lachnospiraceae bacterium]
MKIRTYSELIALPTFEERYRYLKLDGTVGQETFGFDRYMNQQFYQSQEWRSIRDAVIIRDNACDLALPGYDIFGKVLIHHMNPISMDDIKRRSEFLLNPEYLICVTHRTHQAIHYGDENLLSKEPVERTKNDTCPWRH